MEGTNTCVGIITSVQRFSVHDGPGIRTTVFLKGCNLRCFWCHNPETWRREPEVQIFPERCIACQACEERCQQGAHLFTNGDHVYRRELCIACGECVSTCYAQGLVMVGSRVTLEKLVAEIVADRAFYAESGGGVTLSGGEPLLQLDFAYAVLARCRAEGIHTAIETALNFPWARVAAILPVVDLVMFDIKHMDSAAHRRHTGAPNERILDNAKRLGQQPQPLIVRTPVIPGVNDTVEEIGAIARFVSTLPNLLYYELLPFHPLATSKYASLGLAYDAVGLQAPSKEKLAALVDVAAAAGVEVRCAGALRPSTAPLDA